MTPTQSYWRSRTQYSPLHRVWLSCSLLLSIINCSCGSRTAHDLESEAAESSDGDLTENQPNPAMEEETSVEPVDAPPPLPPTPANRSGKEDWLSLTSADDQLWAVSTSGTVLNWEKSVWP